jgi:protein O-mannosyl-transferase
MLRRSPGVLDSPGALRYHNFMLGRRYRESAGDRDAFDFLILILLASLPYLNALSNSFVYDDRDQVLANPYVHSFRYIGRIFGSTVWTFQGAQGVSNYYRPLMTFAYLISYNLFGRIPFGFHLVNLVLHIAIVLLLFVVTERLFQDRVISFISAGLFALHPIHTESVAWIAAITDLELTFFFLLTFLLYLRLADPGQQTRRPWLSYTFMLLTYGLALLSKEQALVLPALLIIYEHFYRPGSETPQFQHKWRRYLPLCLAAAAYIAFRQFVLGGFAPAIWRPNLPWKEVLLSAVALIGSYLGKLIWPAHLTAFYVFHESHSIRDPRVLAGFAGLIACAALFVFLWKNARPLSFALLWMGATLAPVLNARWMPAQVFAERYLYLPSVGFCWLLGGAVAKLWREARSGSPSAGRAVARQAIAVTVVVVACLYAVVTVERNRDWRTDEVLYHRTLEAQPDAQVIHTNLGVLYSDRGDWAGAEREWTLALGPGAPSAVTLNNLGLVRKNQKRYSEAADLFEQAMRLRPYYMAPYKNLAEMYAEMGRLDDADHEYQRAVSLAPLDINARNSYGHFLLEQGRTSEAREQFARSAEADANAEAYDNLGDLDLAAGDRPKARADYQAALALNDIDNHADFGLATLDEQQGRIADAIKEYRAGLETDPRNPVALAAMQRLSGRASQ